jgi:hypothetical protein|tara:strand:- start:7445 stop:7681 length:237 start_codon:yes stop_codon:yes gene_type:complete
MKKSEWERLAHHLWAHSIKLEGGKMGLLLKELVIKCNNNMEMIINDNDETIKTIRKHGPKDTNTTGIYDYEGTSNLPQ